MRFLGERIEDRISGCSWVESRIGIMCSRDNQLRLGLDGIVFLSALDCLPAGAEREKSTVVGLAVTCDKTKQSGE